MLKSVARMLIIVHFNIFLFRLLAKVCFQLTIKRRTFVPLYKLFMFYYLYLINVFIPRHLKSVGYYVIPSIQKFALSVCLSVTTSFPLSFLGISRQIIFKLCITDDLGRNGLGL